MGQNIYPLSATNQQYIPLDVIQSKGYNKQAFSNGSPLGTRLQRLEYEEELLLIRSSEDVIVQFAETASGSVLPDTSFFAYANKDYVLYIPGMYIDLTGDSAAGTAVLNYITRYNTYALPIQLGGES